MSFKKLIKEIEKNPCLWNPNCRDFSNTILKDFTWEQITITVFDCDTGKELDKMVRYLKRKWINLKNSYHQWFSSRNSVSKTRVKKSIYVDFLKFLDPVFQRPRRSIRNETKEVVIKRKSTSTSMKCGNEIKAAPVKFTVVLPKIKEKNKKIKNEPKKSSSVQKKTDNKSSVAVDCQNQHHHNSDKPKLEHNGDINSDTNFLTSISLYIKSFNDDQRLEFKTNVLKIIQKIKHSSYSSPPPSRPQLSYSQCLPSTSNLGRSPRNRFYTFDVLNDGLNIDFNRPPPPLRAYPNFNVPPPPTHGFITFQSVPTLPPLPSITDGGSDGSGNSLIPLQHGIGHPNVHQYFRGNYQPLNDTIYDPTHVTSTTENFTSDHD